MLLRWERHIITNRGEGRQGMRSLLSHSNLRRISAVDYVISLIWYYAFGVYRMLVIMKERAVNYPRRWTSWRWIETSWKMSWEQLENFAVILKRSWTIWSKLSKKYVFFFFFFYFPFSSTLFLRCWSRRINSIDEVLHLFPMSKRQR